ncbi:M16 family metallopeptidase [Clostridium folliculivorans]|uniref:Peptidase M16 n=1 Tax=Clostridium folliculivorans TaxID=2886038 RepID=A0A9W5Y102_9CLOT|nr:pitrilysin family protein [Clostridium folliculivorans]GKU24744.1 peptidase M16 [Clostridium folliculivorans]GKU30842.1 peptidase M16 [Clostridium folliculivorans]
MYNLYTLPNGLRVVTEYIDHVDSISIGLHVENGSRNEDLHNNGISHFIEHMMFKGTKSRNAKQIAEDIENVGGQINAYTSKESTCYYFKALSTHAGLCLEVLSDMMFNSNFAEEDIQKEQGVVVEEINMGEDTPEDVLSDIHAKAAFEDDSLAYPILGTPETVRSFNKATITNYVKSHYTPKNSVLSICGKFEYQELIKLVENYFGGWKSEREIITDYSTPELKSNFVSSDKDIEQLHINLGLKGVPIGDDNGYNLIVLNNILGGGASSLLFQKIREEMGVCYSVYSYPLSYKNTGMLNIYVGLNPVYAEETLLAINEELKLFISKGITKEQLNINKEKIKAGYVLGLESTSSRMFSNGKSVLFLNKINKPEDIISKIDRINFDTVHTMLEQCFKPGIINGAFVGKEINLDTLSTLAQKDAVAYTNSEGNI